MKKWGGGERKGEKRGEKSEKKRKKEKEKRERGKGKKHDNADMATGAGVDHRPPCPCCGGRMIIVESFGRGGQPRAPPSSHAAVRTATP